MNGVVGLLLLTALLATNVSSDKNNKYSDEDSEESTEYFDPKQNDDDASEEDSPSVIVANVVCRKDHSDQCECDSVKGIINCRKSITVHGHHRGTVTEPLTTAAIKTENSTFKAKFVVLAGHTITYLDGATLLPGQNKTIESLDFTNNQIRLIDEQTFDYFPKLQKIRLSHNFISLNEEKDGWITEKLGKSLKKLYLDFNMLGRINDGVFDPLHNLETLFLDGNPHLTLTNKTFGDSLKKLKALSLDRCNLKDLPIGLFENLKSLESLSLIGNPLISVPAALTKLPTLVYLDLSRTHLSEFPPRAFEPNPLMKMLLAKEMKYLSTVDDCAFCGLPALIKVLMSKNPQLYHINKNAFGYISGDKKRPAQLEVLDLEMCNISTLNAGTLDWKMNALSLGQNPLVCDADLDWLINDPTIHLTGSSVPRCVLPSDVSGMSLRRLYVQRYDGSSFMTGFTMACLIVLIVVGSASLALMVFFYQKNRPNPFYSPTMPNVGFSNLSAQLDMDDETLSLAEETEDIDKPTPV